MKEVYELLYSTLSGDAAVTAAAPGGVYGRQAPENTDTPYVVFFKQTGTPDYTFSRATVREFAFVVKGVSNGPDDTAGLDLDKAIEACLTDKLDNVQLANGAGVVMECRRTADVDYPEQEPGLYLRHIGGSYRIKVAV